MPVTAASVAERDQRSQRPPAPTTPRLTLVAQSSKRADNGGVDMIVGSIMVLIGAACVVFGPRIARHGVSLKYSYEELRAIGGPSYRRVRRTKIVATALTMLVGVAFLAGGIRGLRG